MHCSARYSDNIFITLSKCQRTLLHLYITFVQSKYINKLKHKKQIETFFTFLYQFVLILNNGRGNRKNIKRIIRAKKIS